MRTLIYNVLFLSVAITGFALAYNSYTVPPTNEVAVLRDITEPLMAQPIAIEIQKLFDFNGEHKWEGGRFLFSNVTDVSYNPVSEVKIDAANKWLSNELQRDKQIKQFQNDISKTIESRYADTVGKQHSSVYLAIALQLIRLSESKSDKRILVVYSDLMENEPGLSFYDSKVFSIIQSKPDVLMKLFESKQELPSLDEIEVYLVYQPIDAVNDMQFKTVSDFYRKVLKSKGATVTVSANLLK